MLTTRRQLLQRTLGALAVAAVGSALLPGLLDAPVVTPAALWPDAAWSKDFEIKTWSLGVRITREAMEDDLYSFYENLGRELAAREAHWNRELVSEILGVG